MPNTHQHEYHVYVDRSVMFDGSAFVRLTLITDEQAVLFTEAGYEVVSIRAEVPLIELVAE